MLTQAGEALEPEEERQGAGKEQDVAEVAREEWEGGAPVRGEPAAVRSVGEGADEEDRVGDQLAGDLAHTDVTLLLAVIKEFERDKIYFESALKFCPELLVKHGFLTQRKPSPTQWNDIRFGWDMAKEMGRLDIGQSVVVCDTAVIAVEAIEGTDACIRRAGELCRRGGFTVVKVAKPRQDLRFDMPTVGLKTLQTMHEAGGRVLALESEMTILLDQQEVVDLANKLGIAIVSVKADEMMLRMAG